MAIDLDEFRQLKKNADKKRADADRAAGALEQVMGELREDYDCDSIDAATALLDKLKQEEDEAEAEYESELTTFKEKWGDLLDDQS